MFTTPTKIINSDFDLEFIESSLRNHLPKAVKMGIESRGDYYYKVNYDFANLSDKLIEYSKTYLSELGLDEDIEIDVWGNFYPGICVCGKHNHLRRNVVLSGILYVKPENGVTRFFDPMAEWHDQFGYWNVRKGIEEFSPIPNVVLLFPPYLVHDVVMLSDKERITVAFDVKVR
tara:strand:- start:1297 stop:1818 length:522 start_codon:yes stop_codon:yes gene_type:complete